MSLIRLAAGNALGLPKWVQPPSSHPAGLSDGEPTATDIVLQQHSAAWRRQAVKKKKKKKGFLSK